MRPNGMHWIPEHNRTVDRNYIEVFRPDLVKIVNPDVDHIHRVYQANPNAMIVLRHHGISEQKQEMFDNPHGLAIQHVQHWKRFLDDAYNRNVPLPPRKNLVVLGINEPPIWSHMMETVEYTSTFLYESVVLGTRAGALSLNVGWPGNTDFGDIIKGTLPDWRQLKPVERALRQVDGILFVHEYFRKNGIFADGMWGWEPGRWLKCPWDVPVIIGEFGIDDYLTNGKDHKGYRYWYNDNPSAYVDQLDKYFEICSKDPRFLGATIFTSDSAADWESFDMEPAYPEMMARTWAYPDPNKDYRPFTISFPFHGKYLVTQKFGENPEAYAPFKGHMGMDFGTPMHTDILAAADGVAAEVYELPQYGKYIKLVHSWGETLYAHLEGQLIEPNEQVKRGQLIATSGNSGRSTGPHLHFGMRISPYNRQDGWDGYYDPEYYFSTDSVIDPPDPPPSNDYDLIVNKPTINIKATNKFTININSGQHVLTLDI